MAPAAPPPVAPGVNGDMDQLVIVGTSFKRTGFVDLSGWTIPVEFRDFALRELTARHSVREAIYLSTCNRSELILRVGEEFSPRRVKRRWREWAKRSGQVQDLHDNLTVQSGVEAVRYLFRVAASLDSLVLGETEILRQLRGSWRASRDGGWSGAFLRVVLERALRVGKEVRTRTALAQLSTSVVSVAMREIRRRRGGRIKRAVVVGAGETGRAVAKSLASMGAEKVIVVNRTLSKAVALAKEIKGEANPLSALPDALIGADLVVTAVSYPSPLIGPESFTDQDNALLVDLAVPNNIDIACGEHPGLTLLGLPEIEAIAAANRPHLEAELARAEALVEAGLKKLRRDLNLADFSPQILEARADFFSAAQEEIAEILGVELGGLEEEERERVSRRLERMAKRLLHVSTRHLKDQLGSRPRAQDPI